MSGYATITNAGLDDCVVAEASGYATQIYITSFKISDTTTGVANPAATVLPGTVVYSGTSQMTATNLENGLILYTITLDQTVGNFNIGSIGLYTSTNVLFATYALNVVESKTKSSLPTTLGDIRTYYLLVEPLVGSTAINISLNTSGNATLPFVATQADLPTVGTDINYLYVVGSNGDLPGSPPSLAYSVGAAWQYISLATLSSPWTATDGVQLVDNVFSAVPSPGGGLLVDDTGLYINPSFGIVRKYSGTITGNGSTTSFSVSHDLDTQNVIVNVADASFNHLEANLDVNYQANSVNTVLVTFRTAPANSTVFNITVIG